MKLTGTDSTQDAMRVNPSNTQLITDAKSHALEPIDYRFFAPISEKVKTGGKMTTGTIRTRGGQPNGWNERFQVDLKDVKLPDGARFYSTPGHGFLRVDILKLPASVSEYDYVDGPNHVLLEEDCSLTMWLAEQGLIPMEDYIRAMIERIPRTCAYTILHG